jgi:hypothetical protein
MRTSNETTVNKLILLIDGENLPSKFAEAVVAKAATLGAIAEGRVYGHFGSAKMNTWAVAAGKLGLALVDVTRVSRAKNAADFKLVIEAMDMMHTRPLDGFCLASSDGDFSALCERIRAVALKVYGFGEKKAPESYRSACTAFFDCAALVADAKTAARSRPAAPKPAKPVKAASKAAARPAPPAQNESAVAILAAVDGSPPDEAGWVYLNAVGTQLRKTIPDFPKRFGKRLLAQVRKIAALETRIDGQSVFVRRKRT